MARALLRSLSLSCGLLLLLPPGWCCLLAGFSQPAPATHQSAKPKSACCGHCGGERSQPSTPARDHVPGREGKCPCGERIATAPAVPVNAGPDLMLPVPGAVTGVETAAPAGPASEPPGAYDGPSHVHLLNCVWLC